MGSPNIIICYTDVVDDDSKEQSGKIRYNNERRSIICVISFPGIFANLDLYVAYKAFQKDIEVVAQNTLGRNSQHLRTIPLPKNYSPSTNKVSQHTIGVHINN